MAQGVSADFAGASLETLYQPVVRMTDRAFVAVEALARLRHPENGLMLPGAFLPQVEDAGLACELANAVIARALADAPLLGGTPDIAVNVTLDVLTAPDSLAHMNDLARDASVDAGRIILELTESRPVADIEALGRRVGDFRHAGYRVALDDFSPSMAHGAALLALPFSHVKFDHGMTAAAARPGPHATFMQETADAAHALGMRVVAEGVESEQDWLRLRAMGVDAAQGFWIARPLPAAVLDAWSAGWRGA